MTTGENRPIRVLLVDDSPVAIAILTRMLSASEDIEVVGSASNGRAAIEAIPQLLPDVICTDYHMPVMDGLELTQTVMALFPRPILVVSVSSQDEATGSAIFRLLEAGAIDVFEKPVRGALEKFEDRGPELIQKVKTLSGVVAIRRSRPSLNNPSGSIPAMGRRAPSKQIVGIGASTGGPQALHTIFGALPADFPLPIVCVQHISKGFLCGLVDWLNDATRLTVKVAQTREFPRSGFVYFPDEDRHLELDSKGRFVSSNKPACDGHRPSVTVTLESIARVYGARAIGILLTGMGRDGAKGMLEIVRAGGTTLAQDEATSVVFGMPKQAIDIGAAQSVIPLGRIASSLLASL